MRLQVAGGFHGVERADHPAEPPAGHGVGFGDTVDEDGLVGQGGDRFDDRHGAHSVVDEVLVDLVGDDPNAVLESPLADRASLFF